MREKSFHTRKIERFYILRGKALVQLRRGYNEICDIKLSSNENNI